MSSKILKFLETNVDEEAKRANRIGLQYV